MYINEYYSYQYHNRKAKEMDGLELFCKIEGLDSSEVGARRALEGNKAQKEKSSGNPWEPLSKRKE